MAANGRRRAVRRSNVVVRPDGADLAGCDGRFYREGELVEWSSITKTVTARLLTALARAGRVSPLTEVAELLPFLSLPGTTLLDLSRHRSGLPMMHPGASTGLWRDPCRGSDGPQFLERIGEAVSETARGRAGEFRYSNLGYAFLGLALEEACGRSWIDLVREWVLPVSDFPTVTVSPRLEELPLLRLAGFRRKPWAMSDGAYRPAGGLWSSCADLVAYAENSLLCDSTSGWFVLRDGIRFHTGQGRDSGVCVILDPSQGRTGVAHAMLRSPDTARRILERAMFGGAI